MRAKAAQVVQIGVSIDDDFVKLAKSTNETVLDVISAALSSFGIDEDPESCHLALDGRLLFPHQPLDGLEIDGEMLSLRLPF